MKFCLAFAVLALVPSAFAQCNVSLGINYEIQDGKVLFSHTLTGNSFPFTIEYWVEGSSGGVIKPKLNTTNLNRKSFTLPSNTDEVVIKSRIAELGCSNLNKEGEYAEKAVSLAGQNSVGIRLSIKPKEESYNDEKNDKMKGIIPFFIILILSLISIVLIWRR